MNYTKGKWKADNGDSELWGVFTDLDDDGICYMCEPNGVLLRPGEAQANAHLIASAPAMYEALKTALVDIRGLVRKMNWDNEKEELKMATGHIEKALAKAEGK